VILSAGLLACRGRVQRDGEVIHLIAEHLIGLSDLLWRIGECSEPFPVPHGRGDEAKQGGGPDHRKPILFRSAHALSRRRDGEIRP
jgi:error-prone DNA polymerase